MSPSKAPAPNSSPPFTHLIKIFIFIVILGVYSKLHILPSFLRGGGVHMGRPYVFTPSWMPGSALPE